jgi:hypothetical protein
MVIKSHSLNIHLSANDSTKIELENYGFRILKEPK